MKRRNLLAGLGAGFVAGCSKIGQSDPMQALFGWAEGWHRGAHRAMAGRQALAPEYGPADISPVFRGNGTVEPDDPAYAAAAVERSLTAIAEAARAAGFGTVRECRPALEDVVASIESAA